MDFYCPYGAGLFWLLQTGQWLSGGTLDGIGYVHALAGLVVGVWGYVLLRKGPAVLALSAAVLLTLLCVAPVSLGYSFSVTSQAMFYNRFGFAFLGLLILECFPSSARLEARHGGLWAGLSTGAVCALLLFLKASYFMVAVVLALASLLWRKIQWQRLAGIAAGFLIAALPFLVYIRFDVGGMFADLRMAGLARLNPLSPAEVMTLFTQDIMALFALLALGFILGLERTSAGSHWFWRWRFSLLSLALYTAGDLLMATNAQPSRLPLTELLALLLACRFLELAAAGAKGSALPKAVSVALAVIALGITVPNAATDALALVDGIRLKRHYNAQYAYLVPISGFKPWIVLDDYAYPGATVNTGATLVPYLTDGVALLKQQFSPGERVATFDGYNPFPYLLQIPPPHGGVAAAGYGIVFNDLHHPSADAYFGNADIVMYPKQSALGEDRFAGLEKTYGADLARRFTLSAESSRWRLYRRNP